RAQRTARLDHDARHDRHADARRGHPQDAVHLRPVHGERRLEPCAPAGGERRRAQVVTLAEHHERHAAQVGYRDRLPRGERMTRWHGQHELLLEERRRIEHLVLERHVALHPVEERSAQLLLELSDLLAHRWLGDTEIPRGVREVPLLGDRHEIAQLMRLQPAPRAVGSLNSLRLSKRARLCLCLLRAERPPSLAVAAQVQTAAPIPARTRPQERHDLWWLEPAVIFVVLTLFVVYSFLAGIANANYFSEPYLSPLYSPCLAANCAHPVLPIVGPWWNLSPAILIVAFPIAFRVT